MCVCVDVANSGLETAQLHCCWRLRTSFVHRRQSQRALFEPLKYLPCCTGDAADLLADPDAGAGRGGASGATGEVGQNIFLILL